MKQRSIRTMLGLLVLALLASVIPLQAEAAGYRVVVDGMTVPDSAAQLKGGQLTVAVRPFVEAMNGQVTWNAAARMVTIRQGGSELALWVGTRTAYANGKRVEAPVAPFLVNGRMMVPAWWLGVRLGAKVRFDGSTLYVETSATQPGTQTRHELMDSRYYFPYPAGVRYEPYWDTMGDDRYYEGRTFAHEGIDIAAPKGTPIVSV
ncbi:MAG TPA: stalk domain-containing protein, partial [Symbiobacteriaceae bacterium]|nr:stalk domain-containing protein [Symbiobacteriaceae bacterium]